MEIPHRFRLLNASHTLSMLIQITNLSWENQGNRQNLWMRLTCEKNFRSRFWSFSLFFLVSKPRLTERFIVSIKEMLLGLYLQPTIVICYARPKSDRKIYGNETALHRKLLLQFWISHFTMQSKRVSSNWWKNKDTFFE